jgi:lysophospholipase L1-like esterase
MFAPTPEKAQKRPETRRRGRDFKPFPAASRLTPNPACDHTKWPEVKAADLGAVAPRRASVPDRSGPDGLHLTRFATIHVAMRIYLALGDSISIDDYTGVRGGGAPSQLARKLGVELVDLTCDDNTMDGVLADLARAPAAADVVTLTAGGNDLLGGDLPRAILRRLHQIAQRIQPLGARVVLNTVYDPSDGDNDLGRHELGLSRLATIELRRRLHAVNRGIAKLARARGFLLADLERLFHGHGVASNEPWFVQVIEPNLAGATAIAKHWYDLLTSR